MLEIFRLAVTALDKGMPILALQVDQWLTDELARRRKKTARGQACKPVEMVLPLLCEEELERGLAALTAFTIELERVELEVAAAAATATKLQTAGTRLFEAPLRPLSLFLLCFQVGWDLPCAARNLPP